MAEVSGSGLFGARCLFGFGPSDDDGRLVYEERVTVWRARDLGDATAKAEADALTYVEGLDGTFLGLIQAYQMTDDLVEGAEVFSLIRLSDLPAAEYLDRYFDTGGERQESSDGEAAP